MLVLKAYNLTKNKKMKTFLTLLGILFIQVLSAQEASPKHKESIFETIPFEFTKYNNIVIDAIVNDAVSYTHLTLPTTPYV